LCKNPDLTPIIKIMLKGQNFELTEEQYKKKTKADIPKSKWYTENNSAVARAAAENGYSIKVVPKKIVFTKK
jgi:hypothetical protein